MPVGRRAASRCRGGELLGQRAVLVRAAQLPRTERAEQRGEQREAHDRDRRSCPVSRRRHARMPPPHSRRGTERGRRHFLRRHPRESGRRAIALFRRGDNSQLMLRALTIRVSLSVLFFLLLLLGWYLGLLKPTASAAESRRRLQPVDEEEQAEHTTSTKCQYQATASNAKWRSA